MYKAKKLKELQLGKYYIIRLSFLGRHLMIIIKESIIIKFLIALQSYKFSIELEYLHYQIVEDLFESTNFNLQIHNTFFNSNKHHQIHLRIIAACKISVVNELVIDFLFNVLICSSWFFCK